MTQPSKSTSPFRVEGLESRILLSAVPMDGSVDAVEEPLVSDSVLMLEQIVSNEESGSSVISKDELYAEATPMAAWEVFLSGEVTPGSVIEADVIHVADGSVLDGVELLAGQVELGAAVWSGNSRILADTLNINADQASEAGAVLTLGPRTNEGAIALGFDDDGFALDAEEMAHLSAAGLDQLVVGLAEGAHDVTIDGLAYVGDLLLRSPRHGGEFYILSQIQHSGGALRFEGSGETQNTNADTITSGNDILVDDTLQLVHSIGSGNNYGDNAFYFDTTDGGNNPGGADILVSGAILGTGVGDGGTLYLNAGTTGNILIQGGVGTLQALGRIVIENANNVTFEGNVILDSFEQQAGVGSTVFGATSSNFVRMEGGNFDAQTENNITFTGDFESSAGNVVLEVNSAATSGKVWFQQNVDLSAGSLTVNAAKDFEITGNATISGNLQQLVGARNTIFRGTLQSGTIDLLANQEIRFLDTVTLTAGDMTLVSGDVDFEGGAGSVIGALDGNDNSLSSLYLRPTAASIGMDVGDPTGGSATFHLSGADIAALADGFASITIGYDDVAVTSTNAVRIGNAAFLDALSVYGGSFLVNGSLSARTSLLLDADSGLIDVTNTQISVSNEQVGSVWQSSALTLLAHIGDIKFRNGASLLIDNEDATDTAQGSEIFLTSTLGSIINEAGSFGFVEARDLTATAAQNITLLTNVENVSAYSTSSGDIKIDELDGLHVVEAITADGAVTFTSGGDTFIDLIESQTDATDNKVSVQVFGANLHVTSILAGTQGDVQLIAEGQLTGELGVSVPHIIGNALTLTTQTGIGTSTSPLKIRSNNLDAANSLSGVVRVQQDDQRASVGIEIENDSTTAGDYVAFAALGGDVSVDGNGISSASNAGVLLDIQNGTLNLNASISSEGGPVTLNASGAISAAATVQVASNGGDIVTTAGSDLTLAADASFASLGGAIVTTASGNIVLGVMDARSSDLVDRSTWGDVAIEATGYIYDYSPAPDGNLNLYANSLKLSAGTGIGQVPDGGNERALELNAVTLAAETTTGAVALHSLADLTIASTTALSSQTLNSDGTSDAGPTIDALLGLSNLGGGVILLESDAALTASAAVTTTGTGQVVVIGGVLTFESELSSAGGALSISATNDITLTDAAALSTSDTAKVLLISDAGSVLAATGSSIASGGSGAVVISANQNVTLGTVSTTGAIGVEATNGSILSASDGDNTRTVLTGDTLSIIADGSVAGADGSTDALLTDVNTLSMIGGDGAEHNISNAGDLLVGTTIAEVTRYSSLLVGTTVTLDAGSDAAVSGTGNIDLTTTSAGDFLLAAASVISTTGAGSISIESAGAFTMLTASQVSTVNGTIDVLANGTAAIGQISSVDGDITVTSTTGSIIDSDPAEAETDFETTGQLALSASTGVGVESDDRQTLTVALGTLSATTATGGIFVSSSSSFATNGLSTTTSGAISVLSDGALSIGNDLSNVAIDSAADLILRAGTNLTQAVDGTISAATDVSLYAGDDMLLFSVATPGNVALEATGSVTGYADPTVAAISASGLLLDGVGSVGLPTQRLATDVDSLAGTVSSGTLAFDNASSLTLEPVSVSTTPIGPMGTLALSPLVQFGTTLTLNGLGSGLFATITGDLDVSSAGATAVAVTEALPVLWETSGNQIWNGILYYAAGDATLRAAGSLTVSGTGALQSNGGDLSLEVGGDVTLASGGTISLTSGSGIFHAGGDITVGGAISTTGAVALKAGDSILAGTADGQIRVTASDLILTAGDGIGSDTSALTTQVSRITSLSSASGTFLNNTGNVDVTNLGFGITSLTADAVSNQFFSGYQGGIQTQLSGGIQFENAGTVQVDPVQAVIRAFPYSELEVAILLNNGGPGANALSVLFEVIRNEGETIDASEDPLNPDLRDGNPPSTSFDSTSGVLRVFVRNDVSTMSEIIDAINAEADFAGTATLVSGSQDGSKVFSIQSNAQKAFAAEGGSYEGLIAYDAGTTAGGLDPIAAVAEIQPGDELYSILVTSTNPGAAANDYTFRILDDGPGGRLTDGTDSAVVEWDDVNGLLDIFINDGVTTAGTIVDSINDAESGSGVPFTAEFGGSFDPADENDVIGDPSVQMLSNLSPEATLRLVGANNDFQVTATTSGPLYNGISFRFIDDGQTDELGVRAVFDGVSNIMSIYINSAQSTANDVIAALNTEGTFSAAVISELSGGNTGAGTIQSKYFQLRDGAVDVNASVTIGMVGSNNDLILTADEPGDDENAIQVVLVSDAEITPGAAEASYDSIGQVLEIRINPDFATAGGIMEAVNLGPNAASIPLTASLPAGTTGFGGISLVAYPKTTGGTGGVARAVVDLEGDNNGFEVVAESDSTLLQNIRVFVIDDGTVTDGSAMVNYFSDTRYLVINLQTGVTTANTVVTAINSAAVPVDATHSTDSEGTGTFGDEAQAFVGGADPVNAVLVTELPSGVTVELESTIGGVINNGINVSYALDSTLAAGAAFASYREADGLRLVQLRAADATTTLDALQTALDAAADVPFTIANIADVGAQAVGDLAPVSATGNEGAIDLTATDSISLVGRVASETGSVSITTTPAGNLTFDAETASIVTIDGIDISLAGAFVNNASLEHPLLKVYDASLLQISTGALLNSSESIYMDTNGSINISGSGLQLTNSDFVAEAGEAIQIDAVINAASVSAMTITAGTDFTLTANGALTADSISITATTGIATIAGSANGDSFELTASGDISQTGTILTTAALDLTSQFGAILMSGSAVSTSGTGAIRYTADSDIEVTSIVSTDGGSITLTSGAAIKNSRTTVGTNLSTTGELVLAAQTGIGLVGDPIRVSSGTLNLSNAGASGDIIVTEVSAGGNLEVTGLTQSSADGWSILTTENGNAAFTGAVLHHGTGALLVDSSAAISTDANATITLQGGALTLTAVFNISLGANASTNGGDVYIDSDADITMTPAMTLDADGGDVAMLAVGDIEVAQILSALAGVHIASTGGSVRRSANDGRKNVIATNLQLQAGFALGGLASVDEALIVEVDRLTATATSGVLAIDSVSDTAIGSTTVEVDFVSADKSTDSDSWSTTQVLVSDGNAVLTGRAAFTFETIPAGPTLAVNGNLLLSSTTSITLNGDTNLTGGSALLVSGTDFFLNGDLDLAGTGTLLIEAGEDFAQAATSSLDTVNLDTIIAAAATLTISNVDIGTGDLALTAGGTVQRPSTAPSTQLIANQIRLESGASIGSVADPLVFDATRMSASSTGGIRLSGVGAVEVNSVEVIADQISTLGAADTQRTQAAQSDVVSSSGGDVLLDFGGHLILRDGNEDERAVATNGAGRLFISAPSIDAYADIRTLDGDMTIEIAGLAHWIAVPESAPEAGDATAAAARSQTGDIYITIGNNFLMDAGTSLRTVSGNIGVDVTGNFTIGSVDAVAGYVHLSTSGAILDGGDALTDIIADRLQIEAATGAGLLGAATYNPLEISANTISALISNGPLALSETNSIVIGLTTGTVDMLDVDGVGSVAINTTAARYGFESLGGGSVTLVAGGSITTQAAPAATPTVAAIRVAGSGNLLLHANASGASILLEGDIALTSGSLTLRATNGVSMAADVTVETGSTGTIDIYSSAGGFTMAASSTVIALTGDVVVETAGTIAIAGIETGGRVSLTSTAGSILDNEATRINITATSLRFNAAVNVGASDNLFDTEVSTVAGRTTAGAVYLQDAAGGLSIGSTAATSNVIGADSVATTTALSALSGIVTGGTAGTIVVTLVSGDLTVLSGHIVTAAGAGNILLDTPGQLDIQAAVLSTSGSISLVAANDVLLTAGIAVTTGLTGQIFLDAGGALLTGADSRFIASTGNVVLQAVGNIILGGVSTEGRAALVSSTGHIRAAGSTAFNVEVLASQLLLSASDLAGGGVGTLAPSATVTELRTQTGRLAGVAGADGIHVVNTEGLSVGLVTVAHSMVLTNGSLQSQTAHSLTDLTTLTDGASIVLRTLTGSVSLNEGGDTNGATVVAAGSGNILISAASALSVNADVLSTSGHITLTSVGNFNQAAAATIETGSTGTVYLQSTTGALTMANGALVKTADSARIEAQGIITLGAVEAASASVISHVGTIIRAVGSTLNILASAIRLEADAGIGTGASPILIDGSTLAATTRAGGIFLLESNGISVTSNLSVSVSEVGADASVSTVTDATLSGMTTEVDGSIVLVASTGSVTVAFGAPVQAATTGRILIDAASSILVFANITSGSGHISIDAGSGILVGNTVTISTGLADISIDAGTGALTQIASVTVSASGNVRLAASGNVSLGQVSGTSVSILSGANIVAAAGSTSNVSATALRLDAGLAIGTGSTHLDISVSQLAALAQSGGIFLTEADDVTVTSVAVSTTKVTNSAGTTVQVDAALADLQTAGANGTIVLQSNGGSITLDDGDTDGAAVIAHGSGAILILADADVNANADVLSTAGIITLRAGVNLSISGIDIGTGAGDISLTALTGAVTMPAGATVTSTTGSIRVSGLTGVTLGQLSGDAVSLLSNNGSILGAELSSLNVTANDLRISANGSVGSATRHILTDVSNVSANALTGAIFVSETAGLNVTSVRIAISEIDATGALVDVVDAAQSDVIAGDAVVLRVVDGDLTLFDGDALVDQTAGDGRAADGLAVQAGASGGILLHALNGNFVANASVLAGTGTVTVRALGTVSVNGVSRISTSGAGDISIEAVQGTLTLAANTAVSGAASLRLAAHGAMTIGTIAAPEVSLLSASGEIAGAAGATAQIEASKLRLAAELSIGSSTNPLRTDASVLSARSSSGSIYITEFSDTTVESVRIETNEFTSTAGSSTVVDAAQSDLRTLADGDIILILTSGDLTLNDGSGLVDQTGGDGRSSDGLAVSAHGSGRSLLAAAGSLFVNADVVSTTGLLTFASGGVMNISAGVAVTTAADISIRTTTGGIVMGGTSAVTASGANLRIDAAGALTVGNLNALNVSLLSGGNISKATGSTLNVEADSLRIDSDGSVGAANLPLTTDVDSLAAIADGALFIINSSAVIVGPVSVSVTEFMAGATTGLVTDAALDDLTASNDGALVLKTLTGGIEVPNVSAAGSGPIVLDAAASLLVTGQVNGGSGAITLTAKNDINFATDASLVTTSNGTVYIESTSGAFTMSASSLLDASDASVAVHASGDITIGQIRGELMSLVSSAGGIRSGVNFPTALIADQLRISTFDSIGTVGQILTAEANTVAMEASFVHLKLFSDTIVGTVGGTFEKLVANLNSVNIVDAPISGIVSEGGIDLEVVGDLWLSTTVGILSAGGAGDATLTISGDFIGDAEMSSESGSISITAVGSITSNDFISTDSGNILLQATDPDSDILLTEEVLTNSGNITMIAPRNIRLTAGADVTSGGSGNLSLHAINGGIDVDGEVLLSAGSGDVSLLANSDILIAGILTTGVASLTSSTGAIINSGTTTDIVAAGSLSLVANSGIGRSGSGSLNVNTSLLSVSNNTGSVYLNSLSATELSDLTLTSAGDLFYRQTTGDLTISGPVHVADGRATVVVSGALIVDAELRAGRDLRIVAASLAITDADLIADDGDITIRAQGDIDFDATSTASASSGSIAISSGGILTVGDLTGGTRVDLRASGSILRVGGDIKAPVLRLFSENGDLGAVANPLFTDSERIDLHAGGSIYISETAGVEIGRAGIDGGGDGLDQDVNLNFGNGTLSSISDTYEFDGNGTLVIDSSGELTLDLQITALNGSIAIDAGALRDGTLGEGLLLEANNGRLTIVTVDGIGGSGNADIDLSAAELTATTATGDIELELTGDTTVVGAGIEIESGAGDLAVNSLSGSLFVDAPITHSGSGSLTLGLTNGDMHVNSIIQHNGSGDLFAYTDLGSILMTNVGRINTNSGLMDIRATGNVILSRVTSLSGDIYIESSFESVRRIEGFIGANIVSSNRPIVQVAKTAQFTVDSNSVMVNGNTIFRASGNPTIIVALFFG